MPRPKAAASSEAGSERVLRVDAEGVVGSDGRSGSTDETEFTARAEPEWEGDPLEAVAWAAWWLNDVGLAERLVEEKHAARAGQRAGEVDSGAHGEGVSRSSVRTRDGQGLATLSPREVEVLGLIVEGLGDKVIAQRLSISGHTVHRHVSNILTKLDVTSRAGAAALGARHGLSPPRL